MVSQAKTAPVSGPNAAAQEGTETLALYYTRSCPFCRVVLHALDSLDVTVELRDTARDRGHYDALVAARGRPTVPVLRITSADGSERWMPESRDIVRYLQSAYG